MALFETRLPSLPSPSEERQHDEPSTPNALTLREALLTEAEIARRVGELAAEITRDYADTTQPLLLVGILKGAATFLADLSRAIARPLEIDFVRLASYGSGTETSGRVRILKDLETTTAGKNVLVVEDILDTGLTLHFSHLLETLRSRGARSVKLCVLLDKPSRRRVEVPVDYRGFVIEDKFVVGYGMDYAEQYRNLPFIGVLSAE